MRKLQTLKFSIYLTVFSLFIFCFVYFGMSVFSSNASTNGVFSENTFIGIVDVSGKSRDEAKLVLEEKVKNWAATSKISVGYKEQSYEVESSSFAFLLNESIAAAVDGKKNELMAELDTVALQALTSIPGMEGKQEELEFQLIKAAQEFEQNAHFNLNDYLPEEEPEVISSSSLEIPVSAEIQNFIETVPTIKIAGKSSFSLSAWALEQKVDKFSNTVFNNISSAVYQAVLPTNFSITERHISSSLPDNIEPGFEAKVDFSKKLDLKFLNPNEQPYTIKFSSEEGRLNVSVIGIPMLYDYHVASTDMQEFKPRTVKQFSPLLKEGQKTVENKGESGMLVTVIREIYGGNGELLETAVISEDFYPPIHRVEIHPLSSAPRDSGSSVAISAPGSMEDSSAKTGTADQPENSLPQDRTSGTTLPPGDFGNGGESESNGTSEGQSEADLWGKPNEQPK